MNPYAKGWYLYHRDETLHFIQEPGSRTGCGIDFENERTTPAGLIPTGNYSVCPGCAAIEKSSEAPPAEPLNHTPEIFLALQGGERFYLDDPGETDSAYGPEVVSVALGNISRFNGHTGRFYSVAEHSVFVLDIFLEMFPDAPPLLQAFALFHDAGEAFTGDATRPLLRFLERYHGIDLAWVFDGIQRRVEARFFGIPCPAEWVEMIKKADDAALRFEARLFFNGKWVEELPGEDPTEGWPNTPTRYHLPSGTDDFVHRMKPYHRLIQF